MKKVILISILLLSVIFVSACAKTSLKNVSVCGDGKCDSTENCACQDCKSQPICQNQVSTNCDDQNQCTEDLFNTTLNTCQHKTIKNCCGNRVCELNERDCNFETYQTNCISDCKLNCPAHLLVQKTNTNENANDVYSYVCADSNCKETGPNKFEITKKSAIKTTIVNNGELTSNLVSSSFYCFRTGNPTNPVTSDGLESFGIAFRDYFNNDRLQDTAQVNSRITGNNFVVYSMDFDSTNLQIDKTDVTCTLTISDSLDKLNNAQNINIIFSK